MKLSLLLIFVLAFLALLAFDEGDAQFGKNRRLHRLRSFRLKKKSRRSRNRVKVSRRKSGKRSLSSRRKRKLKTKESSKKISNADTFKIARLTSKLETLERKLNARVGCRSCSNGPPGKNITEQDLCTAPFVATYEERGGVRDLTRFGCCQPPQELRNGACVDSYCHIQTRVFYSGDTPADRDVRVEPFEIMSGASGDFREYGATDSIDVSSGEFLMDMVDEEGVYFACTREDCCEIAGREFSGSLTVTWPSPTGGCYLFIDAECSFSGDLVDEDACTCGGDFQFGDQFQDLSYRFSRGDLK